MKVRIFSLAILTLVYVHSANASALSGPSCFGKVEIINIGAEIRTLDSGRKYESPYVDLKVIETDKGKNCPVAQGKVYRAIDNNPGILKKGVIIRAGIESGSSMGPNGAVSFLQWSSLTYVDGTAIWGKSWHD